VKPIQEHSAGIMPFKKRSGHWEVFLVQLYAGHWGFPKGHIEKNENLKQTASRELYEETGLIVKKYLSDTPLEEKYLFKWENKLIKKTVTYFLAEVEGNENIQKEEIAASQWIPFDEVVVYLTFPELKALWIKAQELLK
jgi:bis(5'-nucleosidyl)-tetraphosphatase